MSTKMTLMATSLTHLRPLTCAAVSATSYSSRLVPQPPDLIKWVKKEGGFVHPSVKIAISEPYGLGVVASDHIPKGSDLIALPEHVPLQFGPVEADSPMAKLAQQVPGIFFSHFILLIFEVPLSFLSVSVGH